MREPVYADPQFLFDEEGDCLSARIRVLGVGGGGCNAVNNMIDCGLEGIDFLAANTDIQALKKNKAARKIQLGLKLTRGLGAGARPQIGMESAMETADQIREELAGADIVFITAGMGGGTGTGAAPVISRISKEMGILTVAVVTKPFMFEGSKRMSQAESGLMELKKSCHTIIIIPNQRLLNVVERGMPVSTSFRIVDDVLRQAVQGISDLITKPGLINVDLADVKTVMSHAGRAVMGIGLAKGSNRAAEAAQRAISSPLLENNSIEGARGVLISIMGGQDLSVSEVEEAASIITRNVDPDADVIFGTTIGEDAQEEIKVTVIATGFKDEPVVAANAGPMRRVIDPMTSIKKEPYFKKTVGVKSKDSIPSQDELWNIPAYMRSPVDHGAF